jgi:hypothetical protein
MFPDIITGILFNWAALTFWTTRPVRPQQPAGRVGEP